MSGYFLACYLVALGPIFPSALLAAELAFPTDGAPFPATLTGIDADWNVSLTSQGKVRVLPANDLAYWGRYRDVETGPQIILTDGSLIRADILMLGPAEIVIGDATGLGRGAWQDSTLPRDAIRALLFQPPAGALNRDKLLNQLSTYREPDDQLLLLGGESIAGTLLGFPRSGSLVTEVAEESQEVFQIRRRGASQPLAVPAAKVVAVCLANIAPAAQKPFEKSAWMGFRDGSLVHATVIKPDRGALTIHPVAGGELKAFLANGDDESAWHDLAFLQPNSARTRWLSDAKPLGYKHIPFIGLEWPHGIDQNILGGRLRFNGCVFRKGLGMPTASRLAYEVAGHRRFEAEISLDDQSGLEGSAVFKVLVEHEPGNWVTAFQSSVVRGDDDPLPISVDVRGATRFALIVEFADRGSTCDYANWLFARLIK